MWERESQLFQCIVISESGVSQQKRRESGWGERQWVLNGEAIREDDRWVVERREKGGNELGKLQSSTKQYPEFRGPFETARWWNLLCLLAVGQCRGHAELSTTARALHNKPQCWTLPFQHPFTGKAHQPQDRSTDRGLQTKSFMLCEQQIRDQMFSMPHSLFENITTTESKCLKYSKLVKWKRFFYHHFVCV